MNARTDMPAMPWDNEVAELRVPPHSVEAESSVLGGLLMDNAAWDRVGDLLTEHDFYRAEHRVIYAAIGALVNCAKPADVVTVFTELQKHGTVDDAGGLVYLNGLAQYVLSASNIRRYAEIVRERSILRKLIEAADEISTAAFNPQGRDVVSLLDEATAKVMAISPEAAADDWESTDRGMVALLDRVAAQADGSALPDFTPTGLADLDAKLDGGMRGGELIVIGARPGMGKSALGLTIAAHVALNEGKPVGMFSMEMPRAQVNNRLMSLVSHIHLSRVKRGERLRDHDWPALTAAVEKLRLADISINDRSNLNINQVRSSTRGLQRRRGKLGCIVVDYLGLMAGTDQKISRAYQLEEVSKGLKSLAKELDIPVVLLVQVGRKVEERVDQMPILSDIKDSGSVEQDADVVIFVHRAIKANPTLTDEWKYFAKLSVAKVRDGEPGYLDLMYVGENTRFMDWPEETPKPSSQVRTKRADL